MTQVAEVMTRGVHAMAPSDSLQSAAQAMDELNVGTLPVCENDRVIGMVTDRDITVRAVAQGLPAGSTAVSEVMSQPVAWCREDDELEDVVGKLQQRQIRRLVVLDRDEKLIGIVSLGDMATKGSTTDAGDILAAVSEPSSPDRSGAAPSSGSAGDAATDFPAIGSPS